MVPAPTPITTVEQIPELMATWPDLGADCPRLDDECARADTIRLAEWWLSLAPAGVALSVRAGPTQAAGRPKAGRKPAAAPPPGWHYWFELAHPADPKPCRIFRVMIQHAKPPRVFQLQFPMEPREFPAIPEASESLRDLIDRAEVWATEANLRETVENSKVKSISLHRRFPDRQFDRFTALVTRFVAELRLILDRVGTSRAKDGNG